MKPIILIISIIAVLGLIFWNRSQTPKQQTQQKTESATSLNASEAPQTKTLRAEDIPNSHADFKFSATIPAAWQVEAVTTIDSINIFDPAFSGNSNLEKSQIFIRKFSANSFLTLSTVKIHERTELTIDNRPAVRYDIEKKSGVPDFASQPFWRNTRHIVTDVRVTDDNPSVFYVIAKRPDLDDKIYQQFLDSLQVVAKISLIEPIDDFKTRITKKPFGIYITPQTSPVAPEKFVGLHTAVDVEYVDKPDVDIPVRAITIGEVIKSGTAAGYGGILVIKHNINSKTHAVIYGHLDPKSLVKLGMQVKTGQQIGVLGEGNTSETDGERKHLHFGVRADSTADIRGYVSSKIELLSWLDPLTFFNNRP